MATRIANNLNGYARYFTVEDVPFLDYTEFNGLIGNQNLEDKWLSQLK